LDSGVVYCSWKNSTLEFSALSQGLTIGRIY
jgi:hypothetical protein